MAKHVVICVDDDAELLATIVRTLKREPSLDVRWTTRPSEALAWVSSESAAVLLSDYEMPEMTGAQLAGYAKTLRPETVRILLTGRRTLETAVDGINQGEIFRFMGKPFEERALRQAVLEGVHRHQELLALSGDRQRRERRDALRDALEAEYPGISEVGHDDVLEVTADPWSEAPKLGLIGIDATWER
jgi:DNA-binding NtrC family response regulator